MDKIVIFAAIGPLGELSNLICRTKGKRMNKEAISLSVLYKNLIGRLKELIVNPRKAWSGILGEQKSFNEILAQFNLPLIGFFTTTVFLGYLISHQELDFESALKEAIFTFSSFFFGLYASYYLLHKTFSLMKVELDKNITFQLVAYASCIMYLTGSLSALVQETIVIASILNLYVLYLLWIGFSAISTITKEQRVWMTMLSGLIILITPNLIHRLFVYISNLTL